MNMCTSEGSVNYLFIHCKRAYMHVVCVFYYQPGSMCCADDRNGKIT